MTLGRYNNKFGVYSTREHDNGMQNYSVITLAVTESSSMNKYTKQQERKRSRLSMHQGLRPDIIPSILNDSIVSIATHASAMDNHSRSCGSAKRSRNIIDRFEGLFNHRLCGRVLFVTYSRIIKHRSISLILRV